MAWQRVANPGEDFRYDLSFDVVTTAATLNAYAAGAALIVLRTLLLALGVDKHLWIGRAIYGPSRLLIMPFTFVPGSSLEVIGGLTIADATVFAAVLLFPLGMLVLGERHKQRAVHEPLADR